MLSRPDDALHASAQPERGLDAIVGGVSTLQPGSARPAKDSRAIATYRPHAIDSGAAKLSQFICDERIARRARESGVQLSLLTSSSISPDPMPFIGDPAWLKISFLQARSPSQRAYAWVGVDLERHLELSIALQTLTRAPCIAATGARTAAARNALIDAVANVLLEPFLVGLREFGFADARLDHIEPGRLASSGAISPCALAVSIEQHDDDMPLRHEVQLALSRDAWRCVETIASSEPPARAFADLRLPGRMVIGTKRIAIQALHELKSGDVLLRALFPSFNAGSLSRPADDADADPRARHDARAVAAWGTPGLKQFIAAVAVNPHSLVIEKEPHVSEEFPPAQASADVAGEAAGEPVAIDEFELPVQFEIDTVAMSIGQLSSLRAGYVIELPIPFADAQLRLVAHGQTIGYGELVTVGEYLGVRIVRMAHSPGHAREDGDGSIQ
ncbi:type III secretion system cytoplasmic ring protein SctQ [Paraburkholderia humisilvae]|uniref:Flagellar motor switch protein FliN-like C-terminal domain-containing protein n=1 Tax=Paraburkholderia humisilvae TaxID=627669 RepID=A0A6J5EF24_9BURK|nr:type III secretion system cytoplasmic ring protein SctQ [Paraburkholderia humisilvae]CAB3764347.1 hypothetical protein LMG29542_04872 [Paraburkholderia humisilvae]